MAGMAVLRQLSALMAPTEKTYRGTRIYPYHTYSRTVLKIGKTIRVNQSFDAEEAVDAAVVPVINIIVVFQMILVAVGVQIPGQGVLRHRLAGIVRAPFAVNLVQILGGDGRIHFQADIALRFHKQAAADRPSGAVG